MKGLALFDIVSTFLSEATLLIGWSRLTLVVGVVALIGGGAVWGLSRVLCREEKQAGAVISSTLLLLLVAGILGVIHLAASLAKLASPEEGGSSALVLQIGTGIAMILVFAAIHGAFGTNLWKAALLTFALLGSTGAMALSAVPRFFETEKAQLTLLANQCAGTTTEEPWLVKSEAANKRIKLRHARREREALLAEQNAMFKVYTDLQMVRERLNPKDQAGVQAFNQRAAEYSQKTQALRTDLARVDALIAAEGGK